MQSFYYAIIIKDIARFELRRGHQRVFELFEKKNENNLPESNFSVVQIPLRRPLISNRKKNLTCLH